MSGIRASLISRMSALLALGLLIAGCDRTAPDADDAPSEPHSAAVSEDPRLVYERAVDAAEEAKARIELHPKPWPERWYVTLGSVDLRGTGARAGSKRSHTTALG
jgi:hypothetical protein